jgi:5-(aminomethyl)-3-furanmethanol phosphate kinase
MNAPVVVKVGGSLLDWPALPDHLAAYLESRRTDRLVLIVGGGRFADALRHLDSTHALGEARSHALALRVLDFTARVLEELVPDLEVTETLDDLPTSWSRERVPVLAPRRFLDDDLTTEPLPQTWATTTDSIAARLAVRLGAGELVLLKSTDLPLGCDRADAARLGLIDSVFPTASESVPIVTFINFRDPKCRVGLALPLQFHGP